MKTSGRVLGLLVIAALVAGACTGGTKSDEGSKTTSTPTPTQTIVAPPGTSVYLYSNAGLQATMQLKGDRGTLKIQNKTGRELPPPSFYLLDARDGHRVEGSVTGAASIPDGNTTSFQVSFTGLEDKDIGLVVLLMGSDNYGAFVRQ